MHHPDHVRGKTFLVTFSYVTTPYNKKFRPDPFKKKVSYIWPICDKISY